MRKEMSRKTYGLSVPAVFALSFILFLTGVQVLTGSSAQAASNIVPGQKFSWSENAGWTNWSPTNGGAWIAGTGLVGYLWLENIGWIKLGSDGGPPYNNTNATDWGVNNDEHGNLSGYGWSENTGWINFSPGTSRATIDAHGNFSGYAWGENIGWIAMTGSISGGGTYGVATTWVIDETPPTIASVKQDGNPLIAGDLLALRPEITASVTDNESGVNPTTIRIYVDGTAVSNGTGPGGYYDSYDAASGLLTYAFKSDISSGSHSLKIEAKDMAANLGTLELAGLQVDSTFRIANVLNYPNPFGEAGTSLSYQLTQPADVTIKIFTIRGQLIKTLTAGRGADGGLTGFNKLPWDGRDSGGASIPNGVYLYLISATSSDGKTASARGKLASQK